MPSASQIIVSIYLIFVISIVVIDFFSFIKINKKQKNKKKSDGTLIMNKRIWNNSNTVAYNDFLAVWVGLINNGTHK